MQMQTLYCFVLYGALSGGLVLTRRHTKEQFGHWERACWMLSKRAASRTVKKPPMFARPSFLAENVAPSTRSNIARAMTGIGVFSYPGSLILMKYAFSANRQASKNMGTPCALCDSGRWV